MARKRGIRLLGRKPRDVRVDVRVQAHEKERWRRAAPQGNISAWLRSLAEKELRLATNHRTVKKVTR